MKCYLDTGELKDCFGCEACKQICPKNAINMIEDGEGFRYPKIDREKCVNCNLCRKICPYENMPEKNSKSRYVYGGYHKDWKVRDASTSGGAFTAIVNNYCDSNYVIFGAASKGLKVYHTYVDDKDKMGIFRKSKYSQSYIGDSYKEVKDFLKQGRKVLFSGTPCQIAGLKKYLGNIDISNLLTIEVICEGVPSPYFIKKYEQYLQDRYNSKIEDIDYRYTDMHKFSKIKYGKWDFQVMNISLKNGKRIKKDRWINPFWKIWLSHLMSRPSCYNCQFTSIDRVADITLGDLWGIHLYCPELYGNNGGASLIICNNEKGYRAFEIAKKDLFGHELDFNISIKYQSPLRKSIDNNPQRDEFMKDLTNDNIKYKDLCRRWYEKPKLKLLWSKYVWGNRQKILFWRIKNKLKFGVIKNEKRND